MGMALIMRTISGHNVVVVRSVAPGGRADRAGVLVNSRLYSVNDVRISSDAGDDPYAVLGIHKQASSVEVRKSYKRESLQKHPDRPGGAVKKRSFAGTVNYAAPELLLKSRETYGGAVDCWALGCLLFEMLDGDPPFKAATARETFTRIAGPEGP